MRQIKTRFESVTEDMYKDLRESIVRGLRDYQAARKEWQRVWLVIEEHDRAMKLITELKDQTEAGKNGNSQERFIKAIRDEIDIARRQNQVNA